MQRLLLLSLFQYQIAYNVIPQIGGEAYMGYACEEMQNKGRKILHLPEIKVSCTCVRVPVVLHAKEKNQRRARPQADRRRADHSH